jgi:hypothetical protein
MLRFVCIAALFSVVIGGPLAVAAEENYIPALGDIMGIIQFRHIKLWFAGKRGNWELAAYELEHIRTSLEQAATLYHGIPEAFVGATVDPIKTISAAIRAKDGSQFVKGFNEFTAACNACHQGIGRAFIVIQMPTTSPFSDQSFAPPKKPR